MKEKLLEHLDRDCRLAIEKAGGLAEVYKLFGFDPV